MFLREKVFRRLIKNAWKGEGFQVALTTSGNWLRINAADWDVTMDVKTVSNKMLAAMIELTGRMPERGQSITCSKDRGDIEIETYDEEPEKIYSVNRDTNWDITLVTLETVRAGRAAVLQRNGGINKVCIRENTFALLDMHKIQYGKDEKVTGPVSIMEDPSQVCWYSGDCILFIDTLSNLQLEYLTNTLEVLNSRETEYMSYDGH